VFKSKCVADVSLYRKGENQNGETKGRNEADKK